MLEARTVFLRAVLWVYMAMTVVLFGNWSTVLVMGIDRNTKPDHPILLGAEVMGLIWVLTFAVCMLTVCLWIYRAHANLYAADIEGLEYTPVWSVAWLFIPFAFWFKPFHAMRELWNANHLSPDGLAGLPHRHLTTWRVCGSSAT